MSDGEKTPDKQLQLNKRKTPLSRSSSVRSKGIGLNLAVSPVSISPSQQPQAQFPLADHSHKRNKSSSSSHTPLPQVPESSVSPAKPDELKYDIPLPSQKDLVNLDIEEQLRLLAFKEMSIVELKDSIASLNAKLSSSERELHNLREIIQKLLYNELNGGHLTRQRQNSNPRDEAIASTKRSRRRTLSLNRDSSGPSGSNGSSGASGVGGPNGTEIAPESPGAGPGGSGPGDRSSIWTNLSKPLNLIQQFDTMLQNEFEKSLIPQQSHQSNSQAKNRSSRLSEDSSSSTSSIPSPLKSKSSKNDAINLDQYIEEDTIIGSEERPKGRSKDDMMQAVSSSIWSFVNDVRTNVLNSLNDEDATTILQPPSRPNTNRDPARDLANTNRDASVYNLDNGSAVSVDNLSLIDEDDFNKILNLKKD